MKNIFKSSLWMLTLVVIGSQAHAAESTAGLFLEPGVTYEFSDYTINYPAPLNSSNGHIKGLGIMGRLGFHISEVVFLGADIRYSRPNFKDETNNYSSNANAYNWGVTGGVQMPIAGARLWASWIAGGMIDPDASNNLDVKFTNASGWRIGAGFHVLAVSLNFEYQNLTYGNLELQQFGPFTSSTAFSGTELSNKSYIMSLTFPVGL